jgi:hypothetical protein
MERGGRGGGRGEVNNLAATMDLALKLGVFSLCLWVKIETDD